MMRFRARKHVSNQPLPLVVPAGDGTPMQQFPGEVIAPMRQMVTRITREESLPKRLAMIAALRQEGVTFLSQALAATIAHDLSAKVCVVELNWWWPSPATLAAPDNEGLAAVVAGEATLQDVISPTGWSNLALLPSGELAPENRPVMARSNALQKIMAELNRRFDHLILDIPAIRATNDAVPLASLATACCLVIRHGVTIVEDVRPALDDVDHLRLLGVIMNQVDVKTPTPLVKLAQNI